MASSFESGALLGHVYTLQDGLPIRLRLARSSDRSAIGELLDRVGHGASDTDISRLVHFDPRSRYVICASGLVDSTEQLLGIGAITFDGERAPEPDLLIAEPGYPETVAELLRRALVGRAEVARPRAA